MELGTIILIVVGIVFSLIIILSIIYYINSRKIKILLDKYSFSPGEKITGKVLIKKDFPEINEFNIGLICYVTERSYSSNSGSHRREVFNFEKPLKVGGGLTKGTEVPFKITIPKDVKQKIENSTLKTAVNVLNALSGHYRRYVWKVKARIDKKGLDIVNTQKIIVN